MRVLDAFLGMLDTFRAAELSSLLKIVLEDRQDW
jgi:hypothetical protein